MKDAADEHDGDVDQVVNTLSDVLGGYISESLVRHFFVSFAPCTC